MARSSHQWRDQGRVSEAQVEGLGWRESSEKGCRSEEGLVWEAAGPDCFLCQGGCKLCPESERHTDEEVRWGEGLAQVGSEGHRGEAWEDEADSGSQQRPQQKNCNHEGEKMGCEPDSSHGSSPAVKVAVLSPRTILEETKAGRG